MKRVRLHVQGVQGLAIWIIMAGSFVLNFLKIGREGLGDKYYAAAVKSMLSSWHNFFFASFDPGGFVTVDKPAPGLWIQTLSAAIFGFKGWALILPQSLAAVLSVGILYIIVKRAYGVTAGLVSALVLAITPISVAVSRTNQLDSLLLVSLLLAALGILIATERSSLRWLLLGSALIGLGFNIKMFAAYMVLPAFLLLYLLGSRLGFWKKIGHLAAAVLVLAAVSLSWALIVDLTPKNRRPFVGGSKTDSVIELAVDYNGINRLIPQWLRRGRFGFFRGARGQPAGGVRANVNPPSEVSPVGPGTSGGPPQTASGMRGGGPFGFETGQAGILRLFNRQMGAQASWLIAFGLAGAAFAASRMKKPLFRDRRSHSVLLWTAWFFTLAVYFSTAGFFHRYYLNLIAPSVAALCGVAVVELWEGHREKGIRGWILPVAILGAALVQVLILAPYPDWGHWLAPIIIIMAVSSFSLLIGLKIVAPGKRDLAAAAATIGLAGLLVAPARWSITPLEYGVAASMPTAGPDLVRGSGGAPGPNPNGPPFMGFNEEVGTTKLVKFLKENKRGERFLLAVPNARLAWDIILETGEPVMAMGGFMGGDRILTLAELETMVGKGSVRYFLVRIIPEFAANFRAPQAGARPGMRGMFGAEGALREINTWIEEHGRPVPDEAWKEEADLAREKSFLNISPLFPNLPSFPMRPMMRGVLRLYDLRPGDAE
jgi:4-amino-4-deoxy-L-arabinose transferase-like glycosyltransferase